MAIDEDLKLKIIADLEKTGFVSELHAANVLESHGWKVGLGEGYFDRDEGKTREIDISAYRSEHIRVDATALAHIFFEITAEVKKSAQPWVVFKRPLERYEKGCAWNNLTTYINLPDKPLKFAAALQEHSLLRITGWEGSGIHHFGKDPQTKSAWYSAFTAVCKAAEDSVEGASSEGSQFSDDLSRNPLEFYFCQPVVVLEGQLVSAELDGDGALQIEEIPWAPFRFKFRTKHYKTGSYRVDVVRHDQLGEYSELVARRLALFTSRVREVAGA